MGGKRALSVVHFCVFDRDVLLDLRGRGIEHPLEDSRHVPNVELVVEVGGRLTECGGDALVQLERSLHQPLANFSHARIKAREVAW